MAEYYGLGAPKTGFMRIKLGADYRESVRQDEERVFSEAGYNFVLTSAYYTSSTMAYAVGYDKDSGTNFVI